MGTNGKFCKITCNLFMDEANSIEVLSAEYLGFGLVNAPAFVREATVCSLKFIKNNYLNQPGMIIAPVFKEWFLRI